MQLTPEHPIRAPGWFGKLPGMDDLAHRRLPEGFQTPWERWLQAGMARLRVRHEDWQARYLQAPPWCFVLGDEVTGPRCSIGVLAPSIDLAGRCFPVTLVAELDTLETELQGDAFAHARQWWAMAARAVREGQAHALDAVRFEVALHRLFASAGVLPADAGGLALPECGQSLWFTDPAGAGGLGMASHGLPQDEQFEALFGLAEPS
jgi:type VI secretion system protein ImpM